MINKPISNLRKIIFSFLMLIGCFSFLTLTVKADNQDVQDNAHVLNTKTQDYIEKINEDDLNKIKGHPQIAVITQKSLDGESLDQRAQELFDKYQFGRKGYDNGILLLIITDEHKLRMQTGYGVEAAIPDNFVNDLVAGKTKSLLKKGDYNAAVKAMTTKTAKRLAGHEDELLDKQDVKQPHISHHPSLINIVEGLIGIIVAGGLLIIGVLVIISCIKEKGIRKRLRACGVPLEKIDQVVKIINDNQISVGNIPILVKVLECNQNFKISTIPLSDDLLGEIDQIGIEKYKTLATHYHQALQEASKVKELENWPKKHLKEYIGPSLIMAAINELLAENFDPKKLGKKFAIAAHQAYLGQEQDWKDWQKEQEKNIVVGSRAPQSSSFFGGSSGSSGSSFGGDGGSSGGGGGDASW